MKIQVWSALAGVALVASALTLTTTRSFAQGGPGGGPGQFQGQGQGPRGGQQGGQPGMPGGMQGRMGGGGGGGAAMAIDGNTLYVLANGKIYMMNKATLQVTREADLPRPQGGPGMMPPGGAPTQPGGPGEELEASK